MPIWLRNYTFKKIQEFYEEQQTDNSPQQQATNQKNLGPDIQPSYSTKASK